MMLPAVATGNWGCGVFGGDPELKAMIQLLAASAANRNVMYFAFGDKKLCQGIHVLRDRLASSDVSPLELYEMLLQYGRGAHRCGVGLKDWLLAKLDST